jgi:hypothetical protein
MSKQLTGTFQILGWDETPYNQDDDGAKQSHAKITQRYTGDIDGTSELQYLMSYLPDGSAIFVGLEKIACTIHGKSGSFVIQHHGQFEAGVATSLFTIVANSGKNELVGISGKGRFQSGQNGQANYSLEIND